MHKFNVNPIVAVIEGVGILIGVATFSYAVGMGLGMILNHIDKYQENRLNPFVEHINGISSTPFNLVE